jgi:hypothetical protein
LHAAFGLILRRLVEERPDRLTLGPLPTTCAALFLPWAPLVETAFRRRCKGVPRFPLRYDCLNGARRRISCDLLYGARNPRRNLEIYLNHRCAPSTLRSAPRYCFHALVTLTEIEVLRLRATASSKGNLYSLFMFGISTTCLLRLLSAALPDFITELRNLFGEVGACLFSRGWCD